MWPVEDDAVDGAEGNCPYAVDGTEDLNAEEAANIARVDALVKSVDALAEKRAAADAAFVAAARRKARSNLPAATRDARVRREKVRLLSIRPRSRGARRSLRTFPVVTLHPRFPFNVRLTGKTFD